MNYAVKILSPAEADTVEAALWYDAQVPGLGLRFITEIDRCQKALLETQSCMRFLRMFYLYWRTLMVRGAQAIGGHGPSANNRFERSRVASSVSQGGSR